MKRWAIRITVLLACGAIVNIAVAWAVAYTWRGDLLWDEVAAWEDGSGTVVSLVDLSRGFRTIWGVRSSTGWENTLFPKPTEIRRDELPAWSFAHDKRVSDRTLLAPTIMARDDAAGWPLLALRCRFINDRRHFNTPEWGISIEPVTPPFQTSSPTKIARALPLRPIWPGFAINTVFYAAVWWLLFALVKTPFALSRRRRIKRGLCPKCAYDLRGSMQGSACPECGSAIPRSHASNNSGVMERAA